MLKSNDYFDGRVKSISLATAEGPATVGVISPGEYEFSTTSYEYMTVLAGDLEILYPEDTEWIPVHEMETFEVEPGSKFKVKAEGDVPYICLYREDPLAEFDEDDDEDCACDSHCCCK